VAHLARAAEHLEGRHRPDTALGRGLLVRVHIHLAKNGRRELARELLEGWSDCPARTAPRRSEVDDDRRVASLGEERAERLERAWLPHSHHKTPFRNRRPGDAPSLTQEKRIILSYLPGVDVRLPTALQVLQVLQVIKSRAYMCCVMHAPLRAGRGARCLCLWCSCVAHMCSIYLLNGGLQHNSSAYPLTPARSACRRGRRRRAAACRKRCDKLEEL